MAASSFPPLTPYQNVLLVSSEQAPPLYVFRNIPFSDPFGSYEESLDLEKQEFVANRLKILTCALPILFNDGLDEFRTQYSRGGLTELFEASENPDSRKLLPLPFLNYLHYLTPNKEIWIDTLGRCGTDADSYTCYRELLPDHFFINGYGAGRWDDLCMKTICSEKIARVEKAFLIFSYAIMVFKICKETFEKNEANPCQVDISTFSPSGLNGRREYAIRIQNVIKVIVNQFIKESPFVIEISKTSMLRDLHPSRQGGNFGFYVELLLKPKGLVSEDPKPILNLDEAEETFQKIFSEMTCTESSLNLLNNVLEAYPELAVKKIGENYPIHLALTAFLPEFIEVLIQHNANALYPDLLSCRTKYQYADRSNFCWDLSSLNSGDPKIIESFNKIFRVIFSQNPSQVGSGSTLFDNKNPSGRRSITNLSHRSLYQEVVNSVKILNERVKNGIRSFYPLKPTHNGTINP